MRFLSLILLWLVAGVSMVAAQSADNGLATIESANTAAVTVEKLEAAIKAKGMKVFTRIDHAAAATEAGLSMPPATVVIFGNPAGGTPNFLRAPTLAIDLPLKALVWGDAAGKTFLTYNNGKYIVATIFRRHGLSPPDEAAVAQEKLLAELAAAATR